MEAKPDKAMNPEGPALSEPLDERELDSPPFEKPPARKGFISRFLPYFVLAVTVLAVMLQIFGILMRDRLEGRNSSSTPYDVFKFLEDNLRTAPEGHETGGRGFGVVEIPVGTAPSGENRSQEGSSGETAEERAHEAKPSPLSEQEGQKEKIEANAAREAARPPAAEKLPAKSPERAAVAAGKSEGAFAAAKKSVVKTKAETPAREPADKKQKTEAAKEPARREVKKVEDQREVGTEAQNSQRKTENSEQPPLGKPKSETAPSREKFKPDPKGGYAVTVGAFNSQRLAASMEARLDKLGYPHFRSVVMKESEGFTLKVGSGAPKTLDAAEKAVKDMDVITERAGINFTARFVKEDEAKRAAAAAERAGASSTIDKARGQTPLWRIMVGPTSLQVAQRAQERLKSEGFDAVVVRNQK